MSATQRPLSEVARFLGGQDAEGRPRPVTIVDAGAAKGASTCGSSCPSTTCASLGTGARAAVDDQRRPRGRRVADALDLARDVPRAAGAGRAHRSTLIFVNNRRLAERLALRLNELADEEVARAHHGSLAREQRTLIEEGLKAAGLPALVATSSLELGIDMGAIDLVIQIESPRSVARGCSASAARAPGRRPEHRAHLPEVPG